MSIAILNPTNDLTSGFGASPQTIAITAPTSGNMFALYLQDSAALGGLTVTDDQSNTYTEIYAFTDNNGAPTQIFRSNNLTGAMPTQLSVSWGGGGNRAVNHCQMLEMSGVNGSSPVDGTTDSGNVYDTTNSVTFATANANEAAFCFAFAFEKDYAITESGFSRLPSGVIRTSMIYKADLGAAGSGKTLTRTWTGAESADMVLVTFIAAAGGAQTLFPSLVTNSNSFYAATVTASYTLTPSLLSSSNQFFAATITPGAVTLTAGLFTNSSSFFAPIVTPGTVTLTPALLSNTSSFYAATVTAGTVTLTPALFSSVNEFFAATVTPGTIELAPPLVTNSNSFYSATVVAGTTTLVAELFSNSNQFFAATVLPGAVELTPALLSNSNSFFAATIDNYFVIAPSLFSNSNSFYAATVTPGVVTLAPSLLQNSSEFFTANLLNTVTAELLADLFSNTNSFYASRVISIDDHCGYVEARLAELSPRQLAAVIDEVGAKTAHLIPVICNMSEQQLANFVWELQQASSTLAVTLEDLALVLPLPEHFIPATVIRHAYWYEATTYPFS